MRHFLICYDIANPRRLQRLHRQLAKRATPLQYSVFLVIGSERFFQQCLDEAEEIIDERFDDLRGYPLPENGQQFRIGISPMPEGIQWSGLPGAWL